MRTLGVVVAGYCAFLQLYATQPLLPLLTGVFGAGTLGVSLTVTVASLGVAIAAPAAGRLADAFGQRRIILWSAFSLAICSLAAATSPNLPTLLFWRLCQGLCTPGVFSVTVAYINDEWSEGGVGATLSAYVSGTVLGGFSSRLLSGLIAAQWGWRWSFVVLGCLNLAGAFGVWRLLKPERHLRDVARSAGSFVAAAGAHLRNRGLQATYIVGFGILFSNVALFTYVTFYLAAPPFRLEPAALGSIFTVYLIGAAVNPAVGRAIDRYGQRAVLGTAISAAVAGVALTFVPNVWVVCVGLTISSSGVFASTTAANKQIGWVARENRALAVGIYATFYYLGGSLGAFIPGYFWNLGGWPACAAFIAGVQITTVIVAVTTWRRPGPRAEGDGFVAAPELD